MKKILFVNPSLRLYSSTKFLPVGIASVMSYLKSCEIDCHYFCLDYLIWESVLDMICEISCFQMYVNSGGYYEK